MVVVSVPEKHSSVLVPLSALEQMVLVVPVFVSVRSLRRPEITDRESFCEALLSGCRQIGGNCSLSLMQRHDVDLMIDWLSLAECRRVSAWSAHPEGHCQISIDLSRRALSSPAATVCEAPSE